MIPLVHNNFMHSFANDEYFKVKVEPITRPVKTFYEETVNAIEIIYSQKIGQFYVLYSGGKDSEYLLYVCLTLGLDVKPIIISTQYNQYDIKYAFDFCEEHNLSPVVLNIDYDKFIDGDEFNEVFKNMNSSCYHYALNCHIKTKIDGTIITGESSPWLKKGTDGLWYYYEPEAIHKLFEFYENKNLHGAPFALTYTAEQYLAFLKDPTMVNLINNNILGKMGSDSSKIHVYNNQPFFKIKDRPKYYGYELIEKSPIFNHPNMIAVRNNHKKYWRACFFEYHKLIHSMENNIAITEFNNNICDF